MKKSLPLLGILFLIAVIFAACGDDKSPVTSTNRAPGQPTLDSNAGHPADGATGVSLTPRLGWACSDPDGDALTYTVSFGATSPPPVVSADQSAQTYTPETLTYSTTYFWSVAAKDPSGASASSEVWSFTTVAEPAETVSTPNVPGGPASGEAGAVLSFSASGATSSFDHNIEYRFDWGDNSYSGWVTTSHDYSWALTGTYEVKAQARCATDTSIESAWSEALSVTITGETVSTPDIPSGPSSGVTGQYLQYFLTGAVSSEGHRVEYYVDWGDGDYHFWSRSTYVGHVYDTVGTYDITLQARCETHHLAWSDLVTKTVTITEAPPETVSTPDVPSGPSTGEINTSLEYTASGAVSSAVHSVEYRFAWGNADTSLWSTSTSGSHVWTSTGTYDVTVQARCQTHTSIESAWSTALSVDISEPAETITTPGYPSGPSGVSTGETHTYTVSTASYSNLSHTIEYQFDWGDGNFSTWSTSTSADHAWSAAGTYDVTVTARCEAHVSVVSAVSQANTITVTEAAETISTPYQPYAPAIINAGNYINCSASGAVSSHGHAVEYRFDFGDGTIGLWDSEDDFNHQHTYTAIGSYQVKAQARCETHTSIMSDWSTHANVTVNEYISRPDNPTGPLYGSNGDTLSFTTGNATSSEGHTIEYRFLFTDQFGQRLDSTVWDVATTQDHVFNLSVTTNIYCYAHARCQTDTDRFNTSSYYLGPIYVSVPETISTPSIPGGPYSGMTDQFIYYYNFNATSSEGHTLRYRLDWGDGSMSGWVASSTVGHSWTAPGFYDVRLQARCASDTTVESAWSDPKTVEITLAPPETVSTPTISGPTTGQAGLSVTYTVTTSSTSSLGHTVEYVYDWGDGTTSVTTSKIRGHNYPNPGTYSVFVTARCRNHPSIESDPSNVIVLTIN